MASKRETSEVSNNQIWREVIRREDNALRTQKKVYSCNLRALKKDQITDPPTFRSEERKELSEEEDALATQILESHGIRTKSVDPETITVPLTSNSCYGLHNYFAVPDDRRLDNVRRGCEETKYAKNFFNMTGKSAYSKAI